MSKAGYKKMMIMKIPIPKDEYFEDYINDPELDY